jgi:lactoylglutathione lyase
MATRRKNSADPFTPSKGWREPHDTLPGMFEDALVNLYTRDIEAALRFYRDLLGFTETFRTPTEGSPEHVELRVAGFTLGLGTVDAAKRVHGVDPAPGSPSMVLVVWTNDVDAAHAKLAAVVCPSSSPRTIPGTTTGTLCCATRTATSSRSSARSRASPQIGRCREMSDMFGAGRVGRGRRRGARGAGRGARGAGRGARGGVSRIGGRLGSAGRRLWRCSRR